VYPMSQPVLLPKKVKKVKVQVKNKKVQNSWHNVYSQYTE